MADHLDHEICDWCGEPLVRGPVVWSERRREHLHVHDKCKDELMAREAKHRLWRDMTDRTNLHSKPGT